MRRTGSSAKRSMAVSACSGVTELEGWFATREVAKKQV